MLLKAFELQAMVNTRPWESRPLRAGEGRNPQRKCPTPAALAVLHIIFDPHELVSWVNKVRKLDRDVSSMPTSASCQTSWQGSNT